MKTRRLATTGVALVATLSLGLTGCGPKDEADAPAAGAAATTEAPVDARAALIAAAKKLTEDSVRMKLESSTLSGGGVMDPRAKQANMTLTMGGSLEVRLLMVGGDAYVKISGVPNMPKKWLHVSGTALGADNPLNVMPDGDPGSVNKTINAMVDVQRVSDREFKGTLDLTKSETAKTVESLGDKAKAVPFTATVDDQGRLVEMTMDMDSVQSGLGQMKTTYSDFGTAVSVEKPAAGDTQEAPESFLKALGG